MRCVVARVVMAWVACTAGWAEADPLDRPPFTATPAELLAAAKAVPASDAPIVVLREDDHTSFDDRGRVTRRWRLVFAVRTAAGAADWSVLTGSWRGDHQDRPAVRARAIDPRGGAAALEPARITDEADVHDGPLATSARRTFEARLPPLEVGSVVEEEIVVTDRDPRLAVGGRERVEIGSTAPVQSARYSFSAPVARKARVVERQLARSVVRAHAVAGGRETWSYALGPQPATPEREAGLPGDVIERPYVGATIAASWAAIAREVHAAFEQRLAAGPVALPADLPRTPTLATATAIAAWLDRTVKDNGVLWRMASHLPSPPAETVKRGIGGVGDRVAVLVSALRQVGIAAVPVLISAGPGTDVDVELPGLDAFDHAIVRARIAGADVWLDPFQALERPGQLAGFAQGRRALVIAPDTTGLVATPGSTPRDNTYREVKTYDLAEAGAARVTELSRGTGVYEAEERRWIHDSRPDQLHKQIAEYLESSYGGTEERLTSSRADDLATPFEIAIVVARATVAWTDRDRIDVAVRPDYALRKVPAVLKAADGPVRRADYAWPVPHVVELEHRFVVPPGYTIPAVADRTWPIGPATLTQRARTDGRTLIVTLRFESGKPRLTAAEFAEVRKGVAAVVGQTTPIALEHAGLALARAGKVREAIAEIDKLAKSHPKEALHHQQLAEAYVAGGAGEAARREAHRAVELEPKSADAHSMLAWVLRHDTLGYDYGFDHDRAGALREYEVARKLDPKHVGAAADHARLLERDAHGRAYPDGGDLRAAIAAWRVAYALDDGHGLDLARALYWAGEPAEAETIARKLAVSDERDTLLIAAIAAARGAPAALQEATTRPADAQTRMLRDAGMLLLRSRRYADARELFAKLSGAKPATFLVARRAVRPPADDPPEAVYSGMLAGYDPHAPTDSLWDAQLLGEVRAKWNTKLATAMRSFDFSAAVMTDMLPAVAKATVEGPRGAWRVSSTVFGIGGAYYVALDRGVAKVVATQDTPAALGRHVLRLVAARDEANAKRFLDWFVNDTAHQQGGADSSLAALWGPGLPSGRDAIELAAAYLAGATAIARTRPILERCNSTATDARKICDGVLFAVYGEGGQWSELERHAAAARTRSPDLAIHATHVHALALVQLKRYDEAERELDALIAQHANLEPSQALRVALAVLRGQPEDAVRRAEATVARTKSAAWANNELAWLRFVVGLDLAAALAAAKASVAAEPSPERLHTLAAIEAELGDVGAAAADLERSMEAHMRIQPEATEWLVAGRIAEQLGLRDDAIARYRRAKPSRNPGVTPDSAELARRRLAGLGVR